MSNPAVSIIKRRRVLWLSHFLPYPPKGGLMQRSYYLLKELSRYHDIRLVALRQRAHQRNESEFKRAIEALSEFAEIEHVSDLPQDSMAGGKAMLALRSLGPGQPYTVRWGVSGPFEQAAREVAQQTQPDVIHFDTISLVRNLENVSAPLISLNHHNIESAMLLRRAQIEKNPVKKLYFWQEGRRLARVERQSAGRFDLHIVCADLDRERLTGVIGPARIEVVPNGVDMDYFKPADECREFRDSLIFVGDLTWYPNISAVRYLLTEVWPAIVRSRPSAHLRIVGRGASAGLVASAKGDSRVEFTGFVDDIRPLMDESMVYICPIFDGGGTKLKMLDAMAMRKAIVAHPVACEGIGLTDNVDVILASDPQLMADRCIALFDDDERRRSIGAAARKRAEKAFSVTSIGRKLAEIYADAPADRMVPADSLTAA